MLINIVIGYAAAGGLVGLAFLLIGIDRVAPAARGVYGFRPLLLPGLVLLWPWVLWRWIALIRQAQAASRHH